jgi:hypothetical protein
LMLRSTSLASTSTSTRTRESGSSFTVVSMVEPTLEITRRERLGAWFYTGPAGRLVSFSIDLGLSLAALGAWSAKRVWQRVRSVPRS